MSVLAILLAALLQSNAVGAARNLAAADRFKSVPDPLVRLALLSDGFRCDELTRSSRTLPTWWTTVMETCSEPPPIKVLSYLCRDLRGN